MITITANPPPDSALMAVLGAFDFKPNGKKSIDDIFDGQDTRNIFPKVVCQREADRMVERRFLYSGKDGTSVFAKDQTGNYHWRQAGMGDKFLNFVYRYC